MAMMAAVLLLSSCVRRGDFVVDLNAETEAVFYEETGVFVIINQNSRTFHLDADCSYLSRMKEENRMEMMVESTEALLSHGYQPCSRCAKHKK